MQKIDIRSKCSINTNRDADTFVGIKCENGDISISFPLGFHISEDRDELRKDILLLFATLASNTEQKKSELLERELKFDEVDFPLQSYIFIIKDYISRGYYREQEVVYNVSKSGKINWNRTMKTQNPFIQNNDIFYLDFATKKNTIKENEIITLIHKYCVYESFDKIGWLYTNAMPKRPQIKKKDKVFKVVLKGKIASIFNDQTRKLFRHMLAIIEYQGDKESDKNYRYGTYRFEYVWEKMIDKVFGIENKADYFPRTMWKVDGKEYDNASLEPDTIMIHRNNVYILDAKYYKYGVTGRVWDLPESTSINKQITYGEYVASQKQFRKIHGENMRVYNAFLMPFDSSDGKYHVSGEMIRIGEAASNWKDNDEAYQKIQGVIIDVKKLMKINVRHEENSIIELAELIEYTKN